MSIKSSRDKKYWIDTETDNKWSKDKYSKAEALELSKTLIMCSYCTDCSYCGFCMGCEDCTNCNYCTDCLRCRNCRFSDRCTACLDSSSCWRCDDCIACRHCTTVQRCRYMEQCINCKNCSGLVRVACADNDSVTLKSHTYGIIGPIMGSRKDTPIVQYDDKGNITATVGCFHGTLDELRTRVEYRYPRKRTKHRRRYMAFIKAVRAFVSAVTDPDPDIED